mgnify:CR=1 FL=1
MFKLTIFLIIISPWAFAGEFIVDFDPNTSIEEFIEYIDIASYESIWGKDLRDEEFFKSPILIRTNLRLNQIKIWPNVLAVQKNIKYTNKHQKKYNKTYIALDEEFVKLKED